MLVYNLVDILSECIYAALQRAADAWLERRRDEGEAHKWLWSDKSVAALLESLCQVPSLVAICLVLLIYRKRTTMCTGFIELHFIVLRISRL